MLLNYLAIFTLTSLAFIGGALWYGPIFGKKWAQIYGLDSLPVEQQKGMKQNMWKQLVLEFISMTLIIFSIACLVRAIPEFGGIRVGLMLWIGLAVPMTVSDTIWTNLKPHDMLQKILITSGYRLIIFIIAGYILSVW